MTCAFASPIPNRELRAPYDARAVANLFLDLAEERQIGLSQMSLLKLLYFAQGWYLANAGVPLVAHDFEAWQYGPVIKIVRDEFCKFGDSPISGRAGRFNLLKGQRELVAPSLTKADEHFVSLILATYHQYDAWQLSDLTHEAGSPWDSLWNSSEPVGRLGLRIRNEDIRNHFVKISQRFRLS